MGTAGFEGVSPGSVALCRFAVSFSGGDAKPADGAGTVGVVSAGA